LFFISLKKRNTKEKEIGQTTLALPLFFQKKEENRRFLSERNQKEQEVKDLVLFYFLAKRVC